MRGKKAKCDFCGAPFEARRKNAKHCEACRAAIRRADSHAQYRLNVFSRASWERFKLKRENVFSRRRRLMSKAPSGGVLKGLCKSV